MLICWPARGCEQLDTRTAGGSVTMNYTSLSMARLRCPMQPGIREWERVHTKYSTAQINQSALGTGARDGQQPGGGFCERCKRCRQSSPKQPLVVAPGIGEGGTGHQDGGGTRGRRRRNSVLPIREKERQGREGDKRETRASKERKSLYPPLTLSFFILFLRRQMASVNTWKQTELVAICGLQIHFVPKRKGREMMLAGEGGRVALLPLWPG